MRKRWIRGVYLASLASLWACDDGSPGVVTPDAAPGDQGLDRGASDGQVLDGGAGGAVGDRGVDALPGDGAPPDAAPRDATADGPALDAALTDARPADGALADAAGPDAAPDATPDQGIPNPCPDGRRPGPESCDGEDNDCDGTIDEGFGLADACEGEGRCGVGFIECDEQGGTRCSTDPAGSTSQAQPERCNAEDDDCDGISDEDPNDFATMCYEGVAGTQGVGACQPGLRRCMEGRLGACVGQVVPSVEVCNGDDDDCNGVVDEGLPPGEQVCGLGVCRAGAQPGGCFGGVQRDCRPGPPTGDDSDCDGQDDDCDGRTDEGYEGLRGCGLGVCAERARPGRCENGVEVPCVPAPAAPEDLSCDGDDDDCDGRTDEDYQVVQCGIGVCRDTAVVSACNNGVERICMPGNAQGQDDDCDGGDQDCDGRNDEGYQPVARCGVGVCAANPTPSRCEGGREIACIPSLPLGPDLDCNGVDDDCDGRTDEGYVIDRECGQGVCADTAVPSFCEAGRVTPCTPGPAPAMVDDDCDGQDTDCDGRIDDEVIRLVNGEQRITNHGLGAIQPAVARSGNAVGVVWSDARNNTADLYFARLDPAGQRVGGDVLLRLLGGSKLRPSIASDGAGGFGVVWHNTRTGRAQVHFARIDANGGILVADTRLVETQANAYNARIVFNGAEFGVVWADQREITDYIWFMRVSTLGERIGAAQRISLGVEPATVPSLAHRGPNGGWAVAYNLDQQGDFDVALQPLAADGTPQGARRILSAGQANSLAPVIVPTAAGWATAWYDTRHDNTEIYFALSGQDGERIGPEVRVTEDQRPSYLPSLAATPTGFAVAFSDRRAGNDEIWFQHLDALGAPFGQIERISNGAGNSFGPALIWEAGAFALAWYDARDGGQEIYFGIGPIGCGP